MGRARVDYDRMTEVQLWLTLKSRLWVAENEARHGVSFRFIRNALEIAKDCATELDKRGTEPPLFRI